MKPTTSTLLLIDLVRLAGYGLRSRPLRAVLSGLGIAIGIAAMVAVVGIGYSSRAEVEARLDQLGTDLLTLSTGTTLFGENAELDYRAIGMVERIGPVTAVTATGAVDAKAYRSDLIPRTDSGGIAVLATELDLLKVVAPHTEPVVDGVWLNAATARYPAVVLGAQTAELLGISTTGGTTGELTDIGDGKSGGSGVDRSVQIGGRWFTVVGILEPIDLAPELDTAALVGWSAAETYLGFDGNPTRLYQRAEPGMVEAVRDVLAATADPEHPEEVDVARPSDALAAQAAIDTALAGLLLGLGGVALLVGGIGVANTMVIAVLERRGEIGLRRALGAGRRHIRRQFVIEALLLSLLGGAAGVVLGTAVTTAYATGQGWPTTIPAWATLGGLTATALIGTLAGFGPAVRAARLDPTTALSG